MSVQSARRAYWANKDAANAESFAGAWGPEGRVHIAASPSH